jgi:tetratricopeptide (TPR) repeat protein
LPVQICGLSSLEAAFAHPCEDILAQCAAGIAACEELSSSGDLMTASAFLATYQPALMAIVKDYPAHRQSAALLTTQCLLSQTILAVHLEHYAQALAYARQAVLYSGAADDIPLSITALGRLAWVYLSSNQRKTALEKALQMQAVFQQNAKKLSANLQSYVYGVLAKNQAMNRQDDAALQALQQAHKAFYGPSSHTSIRHDEANFLTDDGVTHLFLAQPDAAIQTFARIIQPDNLAARIPLSRRFYPEVVNNFTLALLKRPQRDMEQIIFCWQTGLQGAQSLRSEQRLKESIQLQTLMEAIWPGEKRIVELRDHITHWDE